ncbi:serine hydrolase domain-containing protein [Hyphomonas sp.]|uniref:serine hydrolase domain-containing protein n=1 Tax=Hyphomonas sp. TaxID=87 RepID=UPI00391A0A6D
MAQNRPAPALPPLPAQPESVPWPTLAWPEAALPPAIEARLTPLIGHAFANPAPDDLGETHAFLAIQGGRIVAERYAAGLTPDSTHPSWSKAKSITHALIGLLVREGKLDIHAPAAVPEWQSAGDPRRAITLDQLLRMSSGLQFAEDYVDAGVSDVIEMLFGAGKSDVAAYAASLPLAHPPGTVWNYASGTTNIIARLAAHTLGASGDAFRDFMFAELFTPLGMTSASPKFDAAGTFIGSSFCYCTARDFARFGLLYLRDGIWDGRRLLPEGWVGYARTPTPVPPTERLGYGAHWWLGMAGPGSFSANGYEGQYTLLVPDLDLILVRHGKSALTQKDAVQDWMADVAGCFRS